MCMTFRKIVKQATIEVTKNYKNTPEEGEALRKYRTEILVKVEEYLDAVIRSSNIKKHLYSIVPD